MAKTSMSKHVREELIWFEESDKKIWLHAPERQDILQPHLIVTAISYFNGIKIFKELLKQKNYNVNDDQRANERCNIKHDKWLSDKMTFNLRRVKNKKGWPSFGRKIRIRAREEFANQGFYFFGR